MTTKPTLVDLPKLRKIIAGLELGDKKFNEYIEARWLNYVEWWDSRARGARSRYYFLRGAVVIAGALIPALVGLRELEFWKQYSWVFAIGSIVASLVVAICAGIESLYNFGDVWREKRNAVEFLKSEGFSFFELTGNYADFTSHQAAYKTFAEKVEVLVRSEIKEYVTAVASNKSDKK